MAASISTEDVSRLLLAVIMFVTGGWAGISILRTHNEYVAHYAFLALWSMLAGLGMAGLIAPENWLPPFFREAINVSFSAVAVGWASLVARYERHARLGR